MKAEPRNRKFDLCPYLGQDSDPETAYAFPSEWNFCAHSKPASHISLRHQEEFCLTSRHIVCKEYLLDPQRIQVQAHSANHRKKYPQRNWVLLGSILFLGLVISIAWNLIAHPLRPKNGSVIPSPQTELPLLTLETSSSLVMPTTTSSPVSQEIQTETPAFFRGLETPLGVDRKYIIHQIQAGDSLELIASHYGTSVAALLASNHTLPVPLISGWTIVAPLNTMDAAGLPAFDVYGITETILTEELAVRLAVDLEIFKYYNDLAEGQTLAPGEWVLVPRGETPTP